MRRFLEWFGIFCFVLLGAAPSALADPLASAPSIDEFRLLERNRVGRFVFEYRYGLAVRNASSTSFGPVTLRVDALAYPGVVLLDDKVEFPALPAGATVLGEDTIRVRVDRRFPFDPSTLSVRFEVEDVNYEPAASPTVAVPIGPAGDEFSFVGGDGASYRFRIPAGAVVDDDLEITASEVARIEGAPPGGIRAAIRFGPPGTRFLVPPTLTADLTAVLGPGEIVVPVLTDADGRRTRVLFDRLRTAEGLVAPNAYRILVPHFSVLTFEDECLSCEDVLGNGISQICVPTGGEGSNFGPDHGNPVAREAKEEIAKVLDATLARQVEGGGASDFTDEERKAITGALERWGDSVRARLADGQQGFGGDVSLKNEVVSDALALGTTCQLFGASCDDEAVRGATEALLAFEHHVLAQCTAEGAVAFTLRDVLENAAQLQALGGSTAIDLGAGSGRPEICPLPDYSGEYTASSSGTYVCPNPEDDDSYGGSASFGLTGTTTRTGADSAAVSLSATGGGITFGVSFALTVDELGRVVSSSAGSVAGSAPEGVTFRGSGGVTSLPGGRFSLAGSLTGEDGEGCSGGGSLSIR